MQHQVKLHVLKVALLESIGGLNNNQELENQELD